MSPTRGASLSPHRPCWTPCDKRAQNKVAEQDRLAQQANAAAQANAAQPANVTQPANVAQPATLVQPAQQETPEQLYKDVEQWFDAVMERVSGWYTRKTRNIVLAFAVLITLLLNIDTFAIAHELTENAPLRQAVAEKAEIFLAKNPAPAATVQNASTQASATADQDPAAAVPLTDTQSITATLAQLDLLKQGIDGLGVPVGWVIDTTVLTVTAPFTPLLALVATPIDISQPGYTATLVQAQGTQRLFPRTGADWGRKGAGLVVTMILLSLGAPFWYELLGKLVNMRNAGKPPPSTEDARRQDQAWQLMSWVLRRPGGDPAQSFAAGGGAAV